MCVKLNSLFDIEIKVYYVTQITSIIFIKVIST